MLIYNANGPSGYRIANSLRFRSSASAYLNRTPSTGGNQQTWTWSGWIKKGNLTVFEHLFGAASSVSNRLSFNFDNSVASGTNGDYLTAFIVLGGTVTNLFQTNALFRDPSAWYHVVLAVDTTQAISTDRLKLYVNGALQTFSTYNAPAQNTNMLVNSAIAHNIASGAYSAGTYTFDGYLADINFIDGQALTPSSFGQISTITGVWQPKAYSGTYGTNGFKLNFSNGTSTTTLGYDSSGNSNNWTTNNVSLTAGSTYDWMLDSPTPLVGTSYGVGNYAVLNPLAGVISGRTITSGNLNVATSASKATSPASMAVSSGKWYWEVTCGSTNNLSVYEFGIVATSVNIVESLDSMSGGSYCYYGYNGYKYSNTSGSAYGATFTNGDVIGHALDLDAGTLTFYKNNVSQGTAFTGLSGSFYPAACSGSTGSNINFIANFGQRPFSYTPPTGFKSLCTYNLPAASIVNGASYMAATTYTGNGSSQSITNTVNSVSFQPDLVWGKSRSVAGNNILFDSVRGANVRLQSDTTNAENTVANSLTSFNSNGFTVGNAAGYLSDNGVSYIAWQWKANGAAVSNTAGSITSQVSANTISGFSVVTYTGNGTNPGATIGHGLGVTPSMIITKSRNTAGTWWPTYHAALPISNTVYINDTVASTTYINRFSAVSSTTFTTGTNGSEINASGQTYVAYCFAAIPGYSAFGSYTGNGSTDGPFVYCGFRPRFILIKNTTTGGAAYDWFMYDTSRDTYNTEYEFLAANYAGAETYRSNGASITTLYIDGLSNGFKIRNTDTSQNQSGSTYIYAAFAENPFQNALAR